MSSHPTLSLDGKVALVTGGSRGIGAATVRLFVRAGARVVFNYVRAQVGSGAAGAGVWRRPCHAVQADLTGTANAGPLVHAAVERFGSLDALVVNHGIWPSDDVAIDQMTDEQWRTTLAVNLDSAFALVKHAVGADEAAGARRAHRDDQLNRRTARRGRPLRLRGHQGRDHQHDQGTLHRAGARRHLRQLRRAGMGGDRHDRRRARRSRAPCRRSSPRFRWAASPRRKKSPRPSCSCARPTPASSPAKCST